jgi:hypothetical protein
MPYTINRVLENCIRFEVVPHPPYSSALVTPDIRMLAVHKMHVRETNFTCCEKLQVVLRKMALRKSLRSSKATGFENLFGTGGIARNERETTDMGNEE